MGDDPAAHRSLAIRGEGRRAQQFRRAPTLWPVGITKRSLFFRPAREGDHLFYSGLYARLKAARLFTHETVREEFLIAARRIPAGARVLDVGCGPGNFRQCVPHAEYTGLDPHYAGDSPVAGIRAETLADHVVGHAASYDAVCCFEVIEHVRDPKTLFAEIVAAARPGGLICVSVPRAQSPMTRIPNFLINAPPHHLTWWSDAALRALASGAGVEVESVESASWGSNSGIYWIERLSPIKCRDVHFRGALSWHAASAIASLLGIAVSRLFGVPKASAADGIGLRRCPKTIASFRETSARCCSSILDGMSSRVMLRVAISASETLMPFG